MKNLNIICLLFAPVLVIFCLSNEAMAQVGAVHNAPHKSASLDLSNANKGLLIPRVSLVNTTSQTPIVNNLPAQTLTVFNTNASIQGTGAAGTGYYYWDGSLWKKMMSYNDGKDSAWGLNGNAGTNATRNFLGTIDNNGFALKTNNAERMRVTNLGNVGVGTSSIPQYKLETGGNAKVGGNLFLGPANVVPPANVSTLVRDNTTGQVYTVASSSGNTKPVSYVKFRLTNVNANDMVVNCDTKIPASQYSVMVVGASFSSPNSTDGMVMISGYTGTFAPRVAYAFKQGTTWRLAADYKGGKTASNSNGTWEIYCMIINNTVLQALGDQNYNISGGSSGTGVMPVGL